MCHEPSTSLRLNAISRPSGETAGPHRNGECVTSTRDAPPATSYTLSVFRHRELTNATAPSLEVVGDSSGPGPVVNRTGALPASGHSQMLVAPPRLDE